MSFQEYLNNINEGRKKTDIETITKGGSSAGQFLVAFYTRFGSKAWGSREGTDITKAFGAAATLHRGRLMDDGYLERTGPKFHLTQEGLDWCLTNASRVGPGPAASLVASTTPSPSQANAVPVATPQASVPQKQAGASKETTEPEDNEDDTEEQEDTGLAKGVKDVARLKEKVFKVPVVGRNSKYLDQVKTILSHMKAFAEGTSKASYMLAGDPGTGKTSFIKSISTLTGIPLVVIEAPHITQEHLINIPFLVIDGEKQERGSLTVDDTGGKMKVVQAESNLVTRLKSHRKRTLDQIMRDINRSKTLRDIYPLVKSRVEAITGSYNSILFLDEFYRTTSVKIRNVLRNILNGKIGNDKIPAGVYIVMATNFGDESEGIDDIPLNHDFHIMDYDVSSKDDFMSYMYGKYVDNPADTAETDENAVPKSVSVKPEVWNQFMDHLTDEDLGFNDEDAMVRLSPRRLEQMIISIDAMVPVSGQEEARQLYAFVKTNLSNYLDQKESEHLIQKFTEIVDGILEETNPELDLDSVKLDPVKRTEWRSAMKSQLELKMKLGDDRRYIPVISGHPGIGKTTHMAQVSKDMGMGFIQIDVSNLSPEDVTGMPIANVRGDNITTEFSEPNLYITIMKEYNATKAKLDPEAMKGRKYNVVILFDELNRASTAVFNAIRMVLLEKKFENVALPSDVMIVGAINPHDAGAIEFTSHTRDVMDIIPSSGSFNDLLAYLKSREDFADVAKKLAWNMPEAVINTIQQIAMEFRSETNADGEKIGDLQEEVFWWTSGEEVFYVSPREMTELVANTISQVEDLLEHDLDYDPEAEYDEKDFEVFNTEIMKVVAKSFMDTLRMTTKKQNIDKNFVILLGKKIVSDNRLARMYDGIKERENLNAISLYQILKNAGGDITFLDKSVLGKYVDDFDAPQMTQDVNDIISEYASSSKDGMDLLEKITGLGAQLIKTLQKLKGVGMHIDQIRNLIGPTGVKGIFENGRVSIFDVADNPEMVKRIEFLDKGI